MKFKKLFKLLLIIIGMLTIFTFSSQKKSQSDKVTNNLIYTTIKTVSKITNIEISDNKIKSFSKKIFVFVRKLAHFSIYFLLAFFIILYLNEFDITLKKKILVTILVCFIYACTDEIHQLFVLGRSGAIRDVFIDTIGAELALIIYCIHSKCKSLKE